MIPSNKLNLIPFSALQAFTSQMDPKLNERLFYSSILISSRSLKSSDLLFSMSVLNVFESSGSLHQTNGKANIYLPYGAIVALIKLCKPSFLWIGWSSDEMNIIDVIKESGSSVSRIRFTSWAKPLIVQEVLTRVGKRLKYLHCNGGQLEGFDCDSLLLDTFILEKSVDGNDDISFLSSLKSHFIQIKCSFGKLRSLSTPNTFVSSIEILEPELITMNGYNDRVETLPLLFPCLETIFLSFGYNEIKAFDQFFTNVLTYGSTNHLHDTTNKASLILKASFYSKQEESPTLKECIRRISQYVSISTHFKHSSTLKFFLQPNMGFELQLLKANPFRQSSVH